MPTPDDIHTLAGAYAIDALTELERAAFTRHANACETCALETAELQETAARLTELTWVEPPSGLRTRVLVEAARTPQAGGARRHDEARATAAAVGRWRRWTGAAVAAGIIAIGAAAGTWAVADQRVREERGRLNAEQQRTQRISDILAAPDARIRMISTAGGQVSVVVSASRNAGVAVVSDLADPGTGKAYEMWLVRAGHPEPVAPMAPGQRSGTVLLDKVADADAFALSLEEAGGSRTGVPAMPLVGVVPLA